MGRKQVVVTIFFICLAIGCSPLAVKQLSQKQVDTEIKLPDWQRPLDVRQTTFELGDGKGYFKSWGVHRPQKTYQFYFDEFLPALFERTLAFEKFEPDSGLEWMFTGQRGGFTVALDDKTVTVYQRYYDSHAFKEIEKDKSVRHPQWQGPAERAGYTGRVHAVTVTLDHKLGLSVKLNGREVLHQTYLLDVRRHQLKLSGSKAAVSGKMLQPIPRNVKIQIEPNRRHQTMMGFGGITTPTAYAQLNAEGKRRWWQLVCEYNLLIQREYPNGARLNRNMDNWDRLEDATPHYYGDNFPNGEISDFGYIKTLRKLGGKVFFEFWALPKWVGSDVGKYTEAMVGYCKASKERAGAPPDIVGIQNELQQSPQMWHKMTLQLRRALDDAGFNSTGIHMSDHGTLKGGVENAKAFRNSKQAWAVIDYSASHMYDYQGYFTNPDGFDKQLEQWKELTQDKPFLSTELCINWDQYQLDSYRIALAMGQLYHKNLVLTDAAVICYCWTLLNIVQPSYGWTRTLMIPDASKGFVPAESSYQLRMFGAYSRRIREGMARVEAKADTNDLLVSAFAGEDKTVTVIVLNRSTRPRQLRIAWPGVPFRQMETVDPYHQNDVQAVPASLTDGTTEVIIDPGAVITLTSVPLGKLPDGFVIHPAEPAK